MWDNIYPSLYFSILLPWIWCKLYPSPYHSTLLPSIWGNLYPSSYHSIFLSLALGNLNPSPCRFLLIYLFLSFYSYLGFPSVLFFYHSMCSLILYEASYYPFSLLICPYLEGYPVFFFLSFYLFFSSYMEYPSILFPYYSVLPLIWDIPAPYHTIFPPFVIWGISSSIPIVPWGTPLPFIWCTPTHPFPLFYC